MQKTLFCKYLKDSVILDSTYSRIVNYNGLSIVVRPELGAWSVLNEKTKAIFNMLKNGIVLSELKKHEPESLLYEILDSLFFSGIINIDGKNSFDNAKKINIFAGKPKVLVLKYTKQCNLKCEYCYDFIKESNKHLSSEYILKMVQLIQDAYGKEDITIIFHGGEPLLRFKDLKNDIKLLKGINDKLGFSLQTNATLLTKEVAEYLTQEKVCVGVSIDGIDAISNKKRLLKNNKDSYGLTINGIDNLIQAGYDDIGISTVVTKGNYNSLISLLTEFSTKGIKYFNFLDYFPAGRGEGKVDTLSLSFEENFQIKKDILLFLNDFNEGKNQEDKIYERQTRQLITHIVHWGSNYMCAQSPCGAGRRILALDIDGAIYPCDEFISDEKNFSIGNINEIDSLDKALKNSSVIRQCLEHKIENIKECSKCVWKKLCPYHCAGNSYFFNGKLNTPTSKCSFYKKFIPMTIELLYKGRVKVENLI
ncbi:thioether cross-link-forming SCIFF peptide maturase [Bacteroidia bacterium]|nr:thioether cross-link-forming SCIFF peptide maturase [Bacteroidia bacterium]